MKRKLLTIFLIVLALTMTACSNGDIDDPVDEGKVPPVEDENNTPEETPGEEDTDEEEPAEEPEDTPEEKPEDELEEEPVEVPVEDAEDEQVPADWPEEFMPNAPKLAGQTEVVKEEGPKKYFLKYKDISREDIEEYIEEVKAAGFTNEVDENINQSSIIYKGLDKDYNMIKVVWNQSEYTELTLVKESR